MDSQALAVVLSTLLAAAGSSVVAEVFSKRAQSYLDRAYRRLTGKPLPQSADQAATLSEINISLESILSAEPQTLEDRLERLRELMAESSRLSNQVSAELDARAATARKLQEDAAQAEALASVNREQAEAVRRLLEADIAEKLAASGKDVERNVRRDAIRIGVGSFIAGGALTFLITLLVHPLG